MLERPDIQDQAIIAGLQEDYGLPVEQVAFLPLGTDQNTAVFRAHAQDGTPYFLKLRWGEFDSLAVELPSYLSQQGIAQVIPPLAAKNGQLWAPLEDYTAVLYPFIEGRDGYQAALSDDQWVALGAALRRIHAAALPPGLAGRLKHETYTPRWRQLTRQFLGQVEQGSFAEPVAAKLAAFLKSRRAQVLGLVERAERYARDLQERPLEAVLCHADLHAGNLLVCPDGAFYFVDWDDTILAPKERDLMFIGGAQGFLGHTPQEEEALFYRGYGKAQISLAALAYYRCERIVQDIALFCDQILSTDEGGEDREQSFHYLVSNFLPGGAIEATFWGGTS